MADVLLENFLQSPELVNNDESYEEDFEVSDEEDAESNHDQSEDQSYKDLMKLLNDACLHNEEIPVNAYVAEIASIADQKTRKDLLTSYLKQIAEGRWMDRFKQFAQNHPEAFAEFTPDTVYSLAATVKSIEMLQFFLK
ncbi:hypothetical protein HDU99_007758, partial [Rhizoclosmatium hyalinum]